MKARGFTEEIKALYRDVEAAFAERDRLIRENNVDVADAEDTVNDQLHSAMAAWAIAGCEYLNSVKYFKYSNYGDTVYLYIEGVEPDFERWSVWRNSEALKARKSFYIDTNYLGRHIKCLVDDLDKVECILLNIFSRCAYGEFTPMTKDEFDEVMSGAKSMDEATAIISSLNDLTEQSNRIGKQICRKTGEYKRIVQSIKQYKRYIRILELKKRNMEYVNAIDAFNSILPEDLKEYKKELADLGWTNNEIGVIKTQIRNNGGLPELLI